MLTPRVHEIPRTVSHVDVVALFFASDYRARAEQIAEQDATRRSIIGQPVKH